MISFFPDLNVWLALSVGSHAHSCDAWHWLDMLSSEATLIFSRYTQVGLLRLLTNRSVMGEQTLILREAWAVYERWLNDPRVEFHPEPRGIDAAFREATAPFAAQQASKLVGDCYLLAYAKQSHATLVTFDGALSEIGRKRGYAVIVPGR